MSGGQRGGGGSGRKHCEWGPPPCPAACAGCHTWHAPPQTTAPSGPRAHTGAAPAAPLHATLHHEHFRVIGASMTVPNPIMHWTRDWTPSSCLYLHGEGAEQTRKVIVGSMHAQPVNCLECGDYTWRILCAHMAAGRGAAANEGFLS